VIRLEDRYDETESRILLTDKAEAQALAAALTDWATGGAACGAMGHEFPFK